MYGDADLSVEGAGESICLVGIIDLVYKLMDIVDQTKGIRNMYQI